MGKLPIAWYVGCSTPEEKTAREILVRNSSQFATILLEILQQRYESVEKKGLKEEDYSDSNWVFLQAFRNGKLSELADLAELFRFLKKDN